MGISNFCSGLRSTAAPEVTRRGRVVCVCFTTSRLKVDHPLVNNAIYHGGVVALRVNHVALGCLPGNDLKFALYKQVRIFTDLRERFKSV